MTRIAYLIVMAGFLWAPGALAADNGALALFVVGKYVQAEKAGVAEGNATGYAIAARSVLADELMQGPQAAARSGFDLYRNNLAF